MSRSRCRICGSDSSWRAKEGIDLGLLILETLAKLIGCGHEVILELHR